MSNQEGERFWKFLLGMITGMVLTFLYVRFGFEMPGPLGLEQKLISRAVVTTAEFDLYNSSASDLTRRRALAIVLANQPDLFLEVDAAIENRFFQEFLRRHSPDEYRSPRLPLGPESVIAGQPAVRFGVRPPVATPVSPRPTRPTVSGQVIGTLPALGLAPPGTRFPDASEEVLDWLPGPPDLPGTGGSPGPADRSAAVPNAPPRR